MWEFLLFAKQESKHNGNALKPMGLSILFGVQVNWAGFIKLCFRKVPGH